MYNIIYHIDLSIVLNVIIVDNRIKFVFFFRLSNQKIIMTVYDLQKDALNCVNI